MHPCRSRGCKNIKGQSWRSIETLQVQPAPVASGSRLAELAIFFATSNFDLKYFCNLLTYKNVQYLIWKIWFISVWSLKPKAVVWLLTGFMLGQSTLILYHTEANGCIFFATGVYQICSGALNLNNIVALLRYVIIAQTYPIYVVLMYCRKVSIEHHCK